MTPYLNLNWTGVHFWTYPKVNQTTDILASPRLYPHVQNLLGELGVNHDVVIHDIDEIVQTENPELPETRQGVGHRMNWDSYHRYSGRSKHEHDPTN